eukprot:TRINITY_DN16421_c0_g1_i1.p1 TRINITY_DN16421_c0_g1~~TRINITY_DN16421_c0_g1_i1.p1  ORF type:complete len:303 (-),score=63.20 TRINITY_DN16421_c0_g1_i1:155-1063(-)
MCIRDRQWTVPEINFSHWPNGEQVKNTRTFTWSTGAPAYFLNHAAMKLFDQHVDYFLEITSVEASLCRNCPDVYTGLMAALLGIKHVKLPDAWSGAMASGAADHDGMIQHKRFFGYHFLQPRKMLAVDQRVTHEKLDRLINTGDPQAVIHMFREFIDSHYLVLRKRQQEVVRLAKQQKSGVSVREYDIPNPAEFPKNPDLEFGPPLGGGGEGLYPAPGDDEEYWNPAPPPVPKPFEGTCPCFKCEDSTPVDSRNCNTLKLDGCPNGPASHGGCWTSAKENCHCTPLKELASKAHKAKPDVKP